MSNGLQMTIYLDGIAMHGEMPLYEFIVRRLLHQQVAGATVVRGLMGFGRHGKVHRKSLFGVSDDPPMLIVAVDHAERIRAVVGEMRDLLPDGLITLQEIEIV